VYQAGCAPCVIWANTLPEDSHTVLIAQEDNTMTIKTQALLACPVILEPSLNQVPHYVGSALQEEPITATVNVTIVPKELTLVLGQRCVSSVLLDRQTMTQTLPLSAGSVKPARKLLCRREFLVTNAVLASMITTRTLRRPV